ncbi:WD repeat domain 25 [Willisornis vidua]|uniref:WD repeat domain 25 n=1 Tax=Willisornis vidua TaxID=1566151 RepID=A0ABQ9CUP5_9PASS|nr:WD repeat domain 25 [Willisornis vidua]
MNSSLVAYEDSDSETETEKAEVPQASGTQTSPLSSSVSRVQHFAPGILSTKSTYEVHPVENTGSCSTSTVCEDPSEHYAQNNNTDLTSPYCRRAYSGHPALSTAYKNCEQSSSSSANSGNDVSQKRKHNISATTIEGIRPYIPKRLRQGNSSTPEMKESDQRGSSDCGAKLSISGEQTLGKISELIKPYLGSKYKLTEVPKSLIFCMSKHSGPVNEIQWCPVREQSHMLLSASMDKTVKVCSGSEVNAMKYFQLCSNTFCRMKMTNCKESYHEVWDAVDTGCCLKTFSCHSCAVRAAQWSSCGRRILSGGFDSTLHLTDVETGKQIFSSKTEYRISALKFHPTESNIFLCGGFSPEVKALDIRTSKERYTCPSLALHPKESMFVAQTNGNYMALFSAQRPYRINKKKRYEGHKVEGFAVGCEFSPDGTLLATGSSDGKVFFYSYHTSRIIRTLSAHKEACLSQAKFYHRVIDAFRLEKTFKIIKSQT